MANEQYAFLRRSRLPATSMLQSAINDDPDFSLIIDPATNLADVSGFVPCLIGNVESGVEIYFDESTERIKQFGDMIADRDCCLVFRWGGDFVECLCAMVVSYMLAKHYDAVISYEGASPNESLETLRQQVFAVYKEANLNLELE